MDSFRPNPRGSVWHRWDPHIHAPGTLLSDHFGGDWGAFLRRIEESDPQVAALGVTDYFCIRAYQAVRKYQEQGRLPHVQLLFPNVEMRLDIKTTKVKPINIHLLLSPEDPHHENEIIRILGQFKFEYRERQYACNLQDLTQLGRAFDPKQTSDEGALRTGASQFKVTLQDLKDLFRREAWLRTNCLVAVAGGSNDGTAGLQEDDSYAATRREIERFADIIFASTPKQREFWLGRLPNMDVKFIEETYRSLKPCLHGSDAHREETTAQPAMNRYCWLKGDLSFETLRQAIVEPETRVSIGAVAPAGALSSSTVTVVRPLNASWAKIPTEGLGLNAGLVAVIGSRGSGKTALVDLIAVGTNSLDMPLSDSSFLKRALSPQDLLGDAAVAITWGSGDMKSHNIAEAINWPDPDEAKQVCYLSQQFVERLCSSSGLATELRQEMERVVFESTDSMNRLEAGDFETLATTLLDPIRERRRELQEAIRDIAARIVEEDLLRDKLPALEKEAATLTSKINGDKKALSELLPKDKAQHAALLMKIDAALQLVEGRVQSLGHRRKQIGDLSVDVEQTRTIREPARLRALKTRFKDSGMTEETWGHFRMEFVGDVNSVLASELKTVDSAITVATNGDPSTPLTDETPFEQWPLARLRAKREEVKRDVGADYDRQRRYDFLQNAISRDENTSNRLQQQITHGKGAVERRKALIGGRRGLYVDVFRTFAEEEQVLRDLYAPLAASLSGSSGALSKLSFPYGEILTFDPG